MLKVHNLKLSNLLIMTLYKSIIKIHMIMLMTNMIIHNTIEMTNNIKMRKSMVMYNKTCQLTQVLHNLGKSRKSKVSTNEQISINLRQSPTLIIKGPMSYYTNYFKTRICMVNSYVIMQISLVQVFVIKMIIFKRYKLMI